MSYFAKFPLYVTRIDGRQIVMTDFFRRIAVGELFGDVSVALVPYFIKENETPEQVSQKFYGTPFYHWVLLLINNIVNVYEEWPLGTTALNMKITEEYDDPNGVHHYLNTANGYIVDADELDPDVLPVSNIEYEQETNDAKREIRVLDPAYVTRFVQLFDELMGA